MMRKHEREPGRRNFGTNNAILSRLYQFISWSTNCAKRLDCNNITVLYHTIHKTWYHMVLHGTIWSYKIVSWQKLSSFSSFDVVGPFRTLPESYCMIRMIWFAIACHKLSITFYSRMWFIHFVCMEINELFYHWTIPLNAVVVVVLLVSMIAAILALFCNSIIVTFTIHVLIIFLFC